MKETLESSESRKFENQSTLERIDGKYIFGEISSVFNFEKGIFYTIKELLVRPGHTVQEFLLYDRKRLVKPILFVIFSSLFFIVNQKIFGFQTGASTDTLGSEGVKQAYAWVAENFGIVNIALGIFVGFWAKLFYRKSPYNIYEIFVLVFFTIGIGNLIYTLFGIVEIATGYKYDSVAFFAGMLYSTWAIGNFFNERSFWSYAKGMLSYFLGVSMGSFLIVFVGLMIDALSKNG